MNVRSLANDPDHAPANDLPDDSGIDQTLLAPGVRLLVHVHGSVGDQTALECLVRTYALSMRVVEAAIGPSTEDGHLHLYTGPQLVPAKLRKDVPCFHIRSRLMHQYPWTTPGHEIAHFVSYNVLGGRSRVLLEEAVANHFGNVFEPLHTRVDRLDLSEQLLARIDAASANPSAPQATPSSDTKQALGQITSFVCFLLMHQGADAFRALWHHPGPLTEALVDVYQRPVEMLLKRWADFLGSDAEARRPLALTVVSEQEFLGSREDVHRARDWAKDMHRCMRPRPTTASHGRAVNKP